MNHNSAPFYKSILLEKLPQKIKEKNPKYIFHKNTNKIALIIDPRYDELMKSVIHNFMYYMNPHGWNGLIITHEQFQNQVTQDFPELIYCKIDDKFIYYENTTPNISIYAYNQIMTSKELWNTIPAEYVTVFQKDCIMYKMFDDVFLKYDFSGANVYLPHTKTFFNGTINGGFSVRKKSAMLECLEKVSLEDINIYIQQMKSILSDTKENRQIMDEYDDTINEDVYFTFSCEILQKITPDIFQRKKLAIEFEEELYFDIIPFQNKMENQPAVYHGWNKNYHSVEVASYLLKNTELFTDDDTPTPSPTPNTENNPTTPLLHTNK